MPGLSLQKPTPDEVIAFLRQTGTLIVHFSGTPKGAGSAFEEAFPLDLQAVADGKAQTGISASLVRPGDEFDDLVRANATGCVGLVITPTHPRSLVAVSASDCGSIIADGVRTVQHEVDIARSDLERSLRDRGVGGDHFYNEWVVRDFAVLGLFAAPPYRVSAFNPAVPEEFDLPDYLRSSLGWVSQMATIPELAGHFPTLPIWSFEGSDLVRYDGGVARIVEHDNIYPP